MEKTFHEIVRGNVCDDYAEQGRESIEAHGLQINGGSSSEQDTYCFNNTEAVLLKGAGPMLLVHKLLHYFIKSYFQITVSPNIYHILCTTEQVRCYF